MKAKKPVQTRSRNAKRRSDVARRMRETGKLNQETVGDFRHRIAQIMRERERGVHFTIVGAAPAHPCVVRGGRKRPRGGHGEFAPSAYWRCGG